jgi:F-type H+-transporting ATPase subunit gamma
LDGHKRKELGGFGLGGRSALGHEFKPRLPIGQDHGSDHGSDQKQPAGRGAEDLQWAAFGHDDVEFVAGPFLVAQLDLDGPFRNSDVAVTGNFFHEKFLHSAFLFRTARNKNKPTGTEYSYIIIQRIRQILFLYFYIFNIVESPQHLKKRLKSVGNIKKITKAMEMVAATKMRKAQEIALASRPYAFAALDLLANLSLMEKERPMLMERRKVKTTLFVLVASDKGLAGAFNTSVFKKFEQFLAAGKPATRGEKIFLAVGEKASQYLARKNLPTIRKFTQAGDFAVPEHIVPLAGFLSAGFLEKTWDEVIVFSTHFRSALLQTALSRQVLPIRFDAIVNLVQEIIPERGRFAELMQEHSISFGTAEKKSPEYLVEPSPKTVLDTLAGHLFSMQIYHLMLEANASEHSARRLAMKTASDNASDLGEALTLQYNKSRQGAITKEIIEIISGAESLS